MCIGIDIIEIDRIDKIIKRNKFFISCVFSRDEIDQLSKKKPMNESIASRFCAKESFFKCVGEGIKNIKNLKSVKILNSKDGKPEIILEGKLLEKYKDHTFHVSMSHCKKYATAIVEMNSE